LAARYVGASQLTLSRWQAKCPWLDGQGIETRRRPTAYGRLITYYAKDSLDRVKAAQARRVPVPAVPGFVYIEDAAAELTWSARTLRRQMKAKRVKIKKASAKSPDGRALPRSYVPRSFVDECQREKTRDPKPADKITVREAAVRLKVRPIAIHNLIQAGLLDGEDGKGVTTAKGRGVGGPLRYHRKAMLVDRGAVDRLRTLMSAPLPDGPPRPGRPPSRLRLAAERALREAANPPAAAPTPGTSQPTKKSRGGRPSGRRDAEVVQREAEMIDAWRAGRYRSYGELGRAFQVDRSYARKVIKGASARKKT
jgi:hypothetical protein